ncbi:MAG: two pore domain potassium channel family protein [Verrucomicrobia bacterium]|nr:two pore domain potassium channel family protein [Kiritimatiellia bacterium]MCB1102510.1 two pore domain potassium channel family protein [Kiritimatiellia bacterium]MCP5488564.1 two pore domain potassium channel family protein [Verrucomicrobiota bacterium]
MKISLRFLKVFFHTLGYFSPIWVFLASVISGLGFVVSRIEQIPLGRGLYFAWVTGMTVGYGDITPTRPLTAILSIFIAIIGVIFSGLVVALAVNAVRYAVQEERPEQSLDQRLRSKIKTQEP